MEMSWLVDCSATEKILEAFGSVESYCPSESRYVSRFEEDFYMNPPPFTISIAQGNVKNLDVKRFMESVNFHFGEEFAYIPLHMKVPRITIQTTDDTATSFTIEFKCHFRSPYRLRQIIDTIIRTYGEIRIPGGFKYLLAPIN